MGSSAVSLCVLKMERTQPAVVCVGGDQMGCMGGGVVKEGWTQGQTTQGTKDSA